MAAINFKPIIKLPRVIYVARDGTDTSTKWWIYNIKPEWQHNEWRFRGGNIIGKIGEACVEEVLGVPDPWAGKEDCSDALFEIKLD